MNEEKTNLALYIGFFALFALAIWPLLTTADTVTVSSSGCLANGYTVVYVNGVFDTEIQANGDKDKLEADFKLQNNEIINNQPVSFQVGYNPSHLAGLGDLVETMAQMHEESITDYDLDTILMQIYPEVTTRKLLIVGHSQGALYADEMYAYLLAHGEPEGAVNTYSVATPALALNQGEYLSSTNDSLLNALRASGAQVLPANIDIPVGANDTHSFFPGHSFVDSYLAGASDRIVSDISGELSALVPAGAGSGDCFTPPAPSAGYEAQTIAFAVADPAAVATKAGVVATTQASEVALNTAYAFVAGATQFLADTITVIIAPPSQQQANEQTLKVVDKLYGGDLSDPQLQNLLGPGASQGGAVALAAQIEKPVPINGGFVEGTSTSAATSPEPKPSIFPQSLNGPTWTAGSPTQSTPPATDADTDVDDATATVAPPPAPFDASTTPPALAVPACSESLSSDFCFVPETNVALSWSDVENAVRYGVEVNGAEIAATTGTSTEVSLADQASSTVQIVAYDASSTSLASNSQTIYAFTKPVIINEVAWSGTYASPTDQWIELKNRMPYALDATKLTLLAEQGGSQYAPLIGIVNGPYVTQGYGKYYVLERTPNVFTSIGVTPQFVGEWAPLDPAGEQLALAWFDGSATTTLDETPKVSTCSGWCAGHEADGSDYAHYYDPTPVSMERVSADAAGTLASNWASNDGYTQVATDAEQQRIIGSPGYDNSSNWPLAGFFCNGDSSILVPTTGTPPAYAPASSNCTYLAGFTFFIDGEGAGIFEGTVGSSTLMDSSYVGSNKSDLLDTTTDLSSYPPGQYFAAMWEVNADVGSRNNQSFIPDMFSYLETGFDTDDTTPGPPPMNYVVIPFTYAP